MSPNCKSWVGRLGKSIQHTDVPLVYGPTGKLVGDETIRGEMSTDGRVNVSHTPSSTRLHPSDPCMRSGVRSAQPVGNRDRRSFYVALDPTLSWLIEPCSALLHPRPLRRSYPGRSFPSQDAAPARRRTTPRMPPSRMLTRPTAHSSQIPAPPCSASNLPKSRRAP